MDTRRGVLPFPDWFERAEARDGAGGHPGTVCLIGLDRLSGPRRDQPGPAPVLLRQLERRLARFGGAEGLVGRYGEQEMLLWTPALIDPAEMETVLWQPFAVPQEPVLVWAGTACPGEVKGLLGRVVLAEYRMCARRARLLPLMREILAPSNDRRLLRHLLDTGR